MENLGLEESENSTDFIFRGGALALDLVNTEIAVRGKRRDLLNVPADLNRWWELARQQAYFATARPVIAALEKNGEARQVFDTAQLEPTKDLRRTLRTLFEAVVTEQTPNGDDLDKLNTILSLAQQHLEVSVAGKLSSSYLMRERTGKILFQAGLSAFELLTNHDPNRLHKCRNERCILFFYDTTKSATRHWCSLECMNRARSLQNYQQAKAARSNNAMLTLKGD